jgi:hypothetical protein
MSERMSDVDLGVKIIREVWSDYPAPHMAAITIAKLGAAARRFVQGDLQNQIERLTAERDAAMADCGHWRKDYTELQRLHLATDELLRARTMERDAAMAWFRAVEKTGSALCQTFDLATPAEEALRDVLTTACSLAEFEAFRAGAEAMRRKAAWLLEPQNDKSDWTPYAHDCHRLAEAIRALPIGAPT